MSVQTSPRRSSLDDQSPDAALVEAAREGDARACRLLVERYEDRVAATVIGMLGRGADAEDAGQRTFVQFFRHLDRFRADAAVATYLTRIAINEALRVLRSRKRWYRRFTDWDEQTPEPVSNAPPPHEARDREEAVQRALQTLSPAHRAVVVLRMLEGYSTRETAELLDVPEGTVMSRLARALKKLEDPLRPFYDAL